MEIGDLTGGRLLRQAPGAMVMTEAEITGAIDGDNEVALEAEMVQSLHADEPLSVLVQQLGKRGAADMSDKLVEGLGDGEGVLLGARQEVQVVTDDTFRSRRSLSAERRIPKPKPKSSNPHQQRKRR
jgi:hypothetical protein